MANVEVKDVLGQSVILATAASFPLPLRHRSACPRWLSAGGFSSAAARTAKRLVLSAMQPRQKARARTNPGRGWPAPFLRSLTTEGLDS
jgi:hypothetical protein